LTLNFESKEKNKQLNEIIKSIVSIDQNSIVYCYSINSV
jgi:hypothetical protein